MPTVESDVCIIGGGISAALLAQRLARPPGPRDRRRGGGTEDLRLREPDAYRQRWIEYGENPWPKDTLADQDAQGIVSRTMAVGGSALHWGGVTNRFSEEDLRLRSLYGLAVDWPLSWRELERYYCEAERVRIGKASGLIP